MTVMVPDLGFVLPETRYRNAGLAALLHANRGWGEYRMVGQGFVSHGRDTGSKWVWPSWALSATDAIQEAGEGRNEDHLDCGMPQR